MLLTARTKRRLNKSNIVSKALKECELLISYLLAGKITEKYDDLEETKDALLSYTLSEICELKHEEKQYKTLEDTKREFTKNEIANALKDNETINWLATYFELKAFLAKLNDNDKKYEEFRNKAKTIDKDTTEIRNKNLRARRYAIRQRLRYFTSVLKIRNKLRLSLSIKQLSAAVSVVWGSLLFAGYLYANIYMRQFGIDVSYFFSLMDYLALSIEKIAPVLYSAILGSLITLILFYYEDRFTKPKKNNQNFVARFYRESRQHYIANFYWIGMIVFMGLFIYKVSAFRTMNSKLAFLVFSTFGILYLTKNLLFKYFYRPFLGLFISSFLICFVSIMSISIIYSVWECKSSRSENIKKYNIHLASNLRTESLIMIGANSRYIFLYDRARETTLIIPERSIMYVERAGLDTNKENKEIINCMAKLQENYAINFEQDGNKFIKVKTKTIGAELNIAEYHDYVVFTDEWIEHFDKLSEMESFLRLLFSGHAVIIIKYRGQTPVSHDVQITKDGHTEVLSRIGRLFSPFWRKQSHKTLNYASLK